MKIEDLPERMPDRRGSNRSAWTDDLVERLKKLHADGVSFSDIAADLGNSLSRNACIGQAVRLGLIKRGSGINPLRQARAAARPKPTTARKTMRVVRLKPTGRNGVLRPYETVDLEPELVRVSIPAEQIPVKQRKQVLELRSSDCRWPYGDPGTPDFFFCGGSKIPGLPYCAAHARIAYRSSHQRQEARA